VRGKPSKFHPHPHPLPPAGEGNRLFSWFEPACRPTYARRSGGFAYAGALAHVGVLSEHGASITIESENKKNLT
jgi:hypothetical protein